MRVRTVEDSFEYQVKYILREMYKEYEEAYENPRISFEDYVWNERKELGKKFFERIDEYMGLNETIETLNEDW